MNLQDILGLTAPRQRAPQDNSSLGMLMQFIQQGKTEAPQMAPINLPDNSNSPAMQLAAQRQDEAEKLAARRAQLISDAKELSGKGKTLSDDPQVQALIDSGNPQEVALGMKLAEEYKNKQISGQFDEKISYKDWLNGTPESRASMSEFMKLSHPGTNINVGERGAESVVWMTDAQKQQAGLDPTQPYAINQKSGMPEAVKPNEFTDAQNMATGYHDRMVASEKLLDAEMEAGFQTGRPKEALANALPWGIGGYLRDPQMQRVRQAQEDWVRAKLRKESGAAIPPDEMDREIQTYFPGLNETDPSVVAQKKASRQQAIQQLFESTGGKTLNRNPIIDNAAQQLGLPLDHPAVRFATQGLMPGESAGDPNALSYKGASGILQVMPGTQQEVLPGSDPRNPEHQAMAGLLYAKKSLEDAGGDVNEAARRYFAGPGGYQNLGATDGDARHKGTTVAQYGKTVEQRMASPGPRKDRVKHPIVEAVTKNSPANKAAQKQAEEDAAILKQYGL